MENASKALVIVGGVLLAILLISLVLYARKTISETISSNIELKNIENTAKFNEQFANYNKENLQGYELLTLIHKVLDYNNSNTQDSKLKIESYDPIVIRVDMSDEEVKKLAYDGNNLQLFEQKEYGSGGEFKAASYKVAYFETEVQAKYDEAKKECRITDSTVADKIAKSISSIFLTDEQIGVKIESYKNKYNKLSEDEIRNIIYTEMVDNYKSITNDNIIKYNDLIIAGNGPKKNKYYKYACIFYEFMQFKRSIFECTSVEYDTTTGRIKSMKFKFNSIR